MGDPHPPPGFLIRQFIPFNYSKSSQHSVLPFRAGRRRRQEEEEEEEEDDDDDEEEEIKKV